jgi:hypothetical protein
MYKHVHAGGFVDNFELSVVPEPSSAMLIGLTLMTGLGLLRRQCR